MASGSKLGLVSSEILVGVGSVAEQLLSLCCLVITSLDEPWVCGWSSILACVAGRQQESGGFSLHKTSTSCLALCSWGMKEFRHGPSSNISPTWGKAHPSEQRSFFPSKTRGFCWTAAEVGSSSSLADSKVFLTAITFHPLLAVPLTGVTWDQQTVLEFI